MKKGIFRESEGAVILPKEVSGLHTRVFINSQGLPTYEAKELGLAPTKYNDFPYDLSIIVTGNEVNEYFKVLLKALSLINPELAKKTKHISSGMVRLPEGKMSSRTGNIKTAEWLLDRAKEKAEQKIQEVTKKQEDEMMKDSLIAEQVGTGAVKYALLKNAIGNDIEFSFDESISFEGNAGPYLQYTFARTQSVLSRVKGEGERGKVYSNELNGEEVGLLRVLVRFEGVVGLAGEKYAPHMLTNYLFELAQTFNLFYQKYPILKEEEKVRNLRLVLTELTGFVLRRGLYLLGIDAPERM